MDATTLGPTEEMVRPGPVRETPARAAPAPVAAPPAPAPPAATPAPTPRPGVPVNVANTPVVTAAASTPDPPDSSLFSPMVRDRADGGGDWFLQTGQPPPDRSQTSEPTPHTRPSRAPLVVLGVAAGLGLVAMLVVIVLASVLF